GDDSRRSTVPRADDVDGTADRKCRQMRRAAVRLGQENAVFPLSEIHRLARLSREPEGRRGDVLRREAGVLRGAQAFWPVRLEHAAAGAANVAAAVNEDQFAWAALQ